MPSSTTRTASGVFESGQNRSSSGRRPTTRPTGTDFAASSWCNNPQAPINRCDGFARISDQGGDLFGFNTLRTPNAKLSIKLEPKAIHDEMNASSFDEFGRMTANLASRLCPPTRGPERYPLSVRQSAD